MPQAIDPAAETAAAEQHRSVPRSRCGIVSKDARGKEDFDRSLRAEIRDPLWMLTRQWQLGEFKGEDAGSAAKVRVQVDAARLDRFAVKSRADGSPACRVPAGRRLRHRARRWKCRSSASPSGRRRAVGGRLSGAARPDGPALAAPAARRRPRVVARTCSWTSMASTMCASEGGTDAEQLEAAHVQSDPTAWQVLATLLAPAARWPPPAEAIEQRRSSMPGSTAEFDAGRPHSK